MAYTLKEKLWIWQNYGAGGGGSPAASSATIQNSADDELDVLFNRSVTATNSGFTIATDGSSAITITSLISGSGTNTLKFQLSRALEGDETLYFVYDGNGDLTAGGVAFEAFEEPITNNVLLMFNGVSQYGDLGDILDSLFAVADVYFELEIRIDKVGAGSRRLISKFDTTAAAGINFFIDASRNMIFAFQTNSTNRRTIISTGDTVSDGDTITLKYDGSIDTNDGLDRVTFEINGVAIGKSLSFTTGTLPANIPNVADHLGFADFVDENGLRNGVAMFRGNAFDYIVRSVGPVDEVNITDLQTGLDTSGNGRDMTRKTDVKLLTYTLRSNRNVSTGIGYTSPNDWQGRPRVEELSNGAWVMVCIEGDEHTTDGSQIPVIVFSENKGMPWLPKGIYPDGSVVTLPAPPAGSLIADLNLIQCPNGDLVIIGHQRSATTPFAFEGHLQTRSMDNGKTWSAWVDISSSFEVIGSRQWACYDYTIDDNDNIYIGVSANEGNLLTAAKCMLYTSADNCATWTKVSDITAYTDITWESGVCWLGGTTILSVIRTSALNELGAKVKISTDLGATWGDLSNITITSKGLHQPRVKKFANESRVYVSGRIYDSAAAQRNGFLYSDNSGTSWTLSEFTSVATTTDGGYADLIKREDGVLIMMAYRGVLGDNGNLEEYVIIGS